MDDILDFGAVDDGDWDGNGTDNTTAFIAALASGIPVDLKGGTYRCDTHLTFSGSGRPGFYNGRIDFSNAGAGTLISVVGNNWASPEVLSQDAISPSSTLKVSNSSQFLPNSVIHVSSDEPWANNNVKHAEFAYVEDIPDNQTIIVRGQLYGQYLTSYNAKVRFVDTGTQPYFKDLHIKGGGDNDTKHVGLNLRRCAYGETVNLTFWDTYNRGLQLRDTIHHTNDNLTVYRADLAGLGYGLAIGGSQWCSFGDLRTVDCRHPFAAGDGDNLARFFSIGNINGINCKDAVFDTHGGATDYTVGNIVGNMKFGNGSDDAVTLQSCRATIGDINVSGTIRHGILIQHEGNGDPNREKFYKIGFVNIESDADGAQFSIAITNLDNIAHEPIDLVQIAGISSNCTRGIVINALKGDIKKCIINGGYITALGYSACDLISSEDYRIGEVILNGVTLDSKSNSTSHYPLMVRGQYYQNSHGQLGVEDVRLNGCTFKGSKSRSIRCNDGKIRAILHSSSGFTGNEVSVEGNAEVTIDGVSH